MTMRSKGSWRAYALVGALAAVVGCGKSDAAPGASPTEAALDCAAFAERMQSCADDFWTAYAGTDMARNNSPTGDTSSHVRDLRALNAADPARLCQTMADMFGANPRWTPRVNACMEESSCGSWAACIAPALTSAARPR